MNLFSKRLIECRNKHQMTQTDVAKAVNRSRSTISGYETEGKEPDLSLICELAKLFDVSVDYLLGKEETLPEGELKDMIIVRHRDGRRKERELTPEQMDLISAMIDAIPEDED